MLRNRLMAAVIATLVLLADAHVSQIYAVEMGTATKVPGSVATWLAFQFRDQVSLYAIGTTPTSGYVLSLEQSAIDIFPPEFTFYWVPPTGIVMQVVLPYCERATFLSRPPQTIITVHDAAGPHKVSVQAGKSYANLCPRD